MECFLVKVDVFMSPELTIKGAHSLAQDARLQIESALPGVGEVDIDLELDEAMIEQFRLN